jgi:hypothetical protein
MHKRTQATPLPLLIALACALTACQTANTSQSNLAQLTCRIPKIAALPETKESQEKGGLEIGIVPAIYEAVRAEKVTVRAVEPTWAEQLGLVGQNLNGQVFAEQTTTSQLNTQPRRLQFTVRINNKLSRVFRGQGSVVQFNVGGKLIPFGNTDYKDFIDGIVPPRNETELKIYGPPLEMIPEKGTVGIFLYDVVTATDTAGNITEKQNYEWYFNYATEPVQQTGEAKTVRGLMSIAEFQRLMREQQQQNIQQMSPSRIQAGMRP